MNKINRTDKPACLKENAEKWTADLIEKRKTNKKYWYWHEYNKEKVEAILVNFLSQMTKLHCSYCGIYPLDKKVGSRSIDHFKPKDEYLELAFEWANLFIACGDCQSIKGNNYPSIEPLKPDSIDYDFNHWFRIDWKTNHIVPNNLQRSLSEQEIAQKTIDWLGLNAGARPRARGKELEKFKNTTLTDCWEWSYPYFLEEWQKDNIAL